MDSRARALFRALVGRRSGIIREVFEVPRRAPDEPPFFHIGARVADPQPGLGSREGLAVGGSGASLDEALIAALAEGVERYCAASFDRRAIRVAVASALPEGHRVSPAVVAAFSEAQYDSPGFPYPRPDPEAPLGWCRGVDPLLEAPVWAPAAAVYLPYRPGDGEQELCPSTSTGLSCGDSFEAAALGALCEVIERDALALTWLKRVTPPRIGDERLEELGPRPPRDDLRAYDLTTELGVAVALVVGRGFADEGGLLYTGSACRVEADQALAAAYREAMQGRVYVRHLARQDRPVSVAPTSFTEHAEHYTRRPELVGEAFSFLEGGPEAEPAPSGEPTLAWLTEHLAAQGLRARLFDLSQPWCAPLGLSVVRAVMPELLALQGHHRLPMLGHPRLARVADALPRGRVRCAEGEVSPHPHPFA